MPISSNKIQERDQNRATQGRARQGKAEQREKRAGRAERK